MQQRKHWLTFIYEDADVTLRFCQLECPRECHHSQRRIRLCLEGESLKRQDFDHLSNQSGGLRHLEQPPQELYSLRQLAADHAQSRQHDVAVQVCIGEFTALVKFVLKRRGPPGGSGDVALSQPQFCLGSGYSGDIVGVSTDLLCLLDQAERAIHLPSRL